MFNKILLPIDLSETALAKKALKIAIDEARKYKAELHVLTIVHGFSMPYVSSFFPAGAMDKVVSQVRTDLDEYIKKSIPDDIKVFSEIVTGEPAEEILEVAEKLEMDLIIIPSHTRSVQQFLLGSTASKVVLHGNCSVMVVKSSD